MASIDCRGLTCLPVVPLRSQPLLALETSVRISKANIQGAMTATVALTRFFAASCANNLEVSLFQWAMIGKMLCQMEVSGRGTIQYYLTNCGQTVSNT